MKNRIIHIHKSCIGIPRKKNTKTYICRITSIMVLINSKYIKTQTHTIRYLFNLLPHMLLQVRGLRSPNVMNDVCELLMFSGSISKYCVA